MTHASQDSLEAYASGGLRSAARLAVGLHLRGCAQCRWAAARLEAFAGGLLDGTAPEPLSPDALRTALSRLGEAAPTRRAITLDQMIARGWWTPIDLGLSIKRLKSLSDPGERAFLIRARGGAALPDHGHTGREWVFVLKGAFEDRTGRHEVGDLVESDGDERHRPVACAGETCLCLAVTEGPLKLSGIARLAQPLLGV